MCFVVTIACALHLRRNGQSVQCPWQLQIVFHNGSGSARSVVAEEFHRGALMDKHIVVNEVCDVSPTSGTG